MGTLTRMTDKIPVGKLATAAPPCEDCGAPARKLWGPVSRRPFLVTVRAGEEGMRLVVCPGCRAHWFEVVHGPDAAFAYAVLWERSAEDWSALLARGQEEVMRRWHRSRVQALYRSLPPEERRAVQAHRHRSRRQTPVDGPDEETPDLDALLGAPGGG